MAVASRIDLARDSVNIAIYNNQRASPWRGYAMDKCAQDLLVYQEMIHQLKPEIILECGSWYGGSGLFFADMCELVGKGGVGVCRYRAAS